jgi:uncharacterized membrane protein
MIKYIIPTVILLLLDTIYLTSTKSITYPQIKNIQGSLIKLNIWSAILCYITIVLGLYYFIWKNHRPVKDAFLLGLFVYGVYEFTNYAIFKDWILLVVILDIIWGGILFALTTFIFYYIEKKYKL